MNRFVPNGNWVRMLSTKVSTSSRTIIVTPGQGIFKKESIEFLTKYLKSTDEDSIISPTLHENVNNLMETSNKVCGFNISKYLTDLDNLSGSDLQKTSIQQPLMILTDAIINQILKDQFELDIYDDEKYQVDYTLGHSLGEITNLVLQETISFEDGIKLAHERGILMEKLIGDVLSKKNEGYKMYVLMVRPQLFDATLFFLKQNKDINISNINSSEQIVISGLNSDVLKAINGLKSCLKNHDSKFKLKPIDLNVEIPFHNAILKPIVKDLNNMIINDDIKSVAPLTRWLPIPAISNLDGSINKNSSDYIAKILAVTYQTIDFKKCLETILAKAETEALATDNNHENYGISTLNFINFGPGNVTKNLISRFFKNNDNELNRLKLTINNYSLDSDDNIHEFVCAFRKLKKPKQKQEIF
ncbi:hypothetical protein PACTADRAFT_77639 [Pachysolen tannophilus NRRL Y-2460]|uniref:[acyl-carrier-protein] S-malonyltransferase n=1 Tax=Pachysolen tannophilus NRRL Y-2460 TaxID=669874 RepID=A0A1E4TNE6_PACTA|nr:hypothetical protein PACTADRAFT_77639 [Pachysolen tannophilus NRRL Y-2460]